MKINGQFRYQIQEAGIPESEIPFIFDTFRQVEGTATGSTAGFGLGLSIVKQLVNLMNGEDRRQEQSGCG